MWNSASPLNPLLNVMINLFVLFSVDQRISSVEGDRNILEELVEKVEGEMKGLEEARDRVDLRLDQIQKEVEGTKPAYDIQVIL